MNEGKKHPAVNDLVVAFGDLWGSGKQVWDAVRFSHHGSVEARLADMKDEGSCFAPEFIRLVLGLSRHKTRHGRLRTPTGSTLTSSTGETHAVDMTVMPQDHYDFGMRAVKSVLVMAGQLKRKFPELVEDAAGLKRLYCYTTRTCGLMF